MLKNISSIGTALNKKEQRSIIGSGPSCPVTGSNTIYGSTGSHTYTYYQCSSGYSYTTYTFKRYK